MSGPGANQRRLRCYEDKSTIGIGFERKIDRKTNETLPALTALH
jgi:hypothetical protein